MTTARQIVEQESARDWLKRKMADPGAIERACAAIGFRRYGGPQYGPGWLMVKTYPLGGTDNEIEVWLRLEDYTFYITSNTALRDGHLGKSLGVEINFGGIFPSESITAIKDYDRALTDWTAEVRQSGQRHFGRETVHVHTKLFHDTIGKLRAWHQHE